MSQKIAHKISLFSALLIIVTAGSIILAFYTGSTRSQLTQSLIQYSALAQQEGHILNELISSTSRDITTISQSPAVKSYARSLQNSKPEWPPQHDTAARAIEQEFSSLLNHSDHYFQIRFIDSNGLERIRLDRINNSPTLISGASLQDKSARRYVIETLSMRDDEVYISDINLNREHGETVQPYIPTLRVARPIFIDDVERAAGMVIINMDMGTGLKHLQRSRGELTQYTYITNADGGYLAHRDESLTFAADKGSEHRIQDLLPELDHFLRQPSAQQIVLLPAENQARLAVAFIKLHYDQRDFSRFITVGIASPREQILADELALIRNNIFWAVLLTITGVTISLVLSYRISRPLTEIAVAAQHFTENRTPFTQVPQGNDEISQLGRAFKTLTDKVLASEQDLHSQNAELEAHVTERGRELNASRTMLQTVLDALPISVFWKDPSGVYLGCNRNFSRDAGFEEPWQIIGKTDYDMPWSEQAGTYQQNDQRVIHSARPQLNIIESITFSRGSIRQIETNRLPLLDDNARVSGILGSYQDITDRHQAERDLSQSEERLRKSQRIANVGTWDWDITNNTLHWSDEIYTIFGLQPQQFAATYEAFVERIHADDIERVNRAVRQSIANPAAVYSLTHRIIRPNGELRHVEEQGEVYRDSEGKPVRMIGVVHDITERTLAQLETEQAKALAERYLQLSEAIIVELDREGRIIQLNPRGCQILGYTAQELQGLSWFDTFIPLEQVTQVKQVFATLMTQPRAEQDDNSSHYFENELRCHNGELISVSWHTTVNYDCTGHAIGTLSSGQDITQRKRVERLKDEFLSTVSHELRTPLTSIRGSLKLVLGNVLGELPEKAAELLQLADNNSERLLTQINDILDLQKIEAGMMAFTFTPISPRALINEALNINRPYASQHRIRLALRDNGDSGPESIIGDHHRLIQVMSNLISNAVKFSPADSTVEVVLGGDDSHLQIEVNDHGSGIPASLHDQLFRRFTQLDSSDTRAQGGTGLGLHIAKLIVDKHQGTIGYHDQPGGGSSFRVTLPVSME